MGASIGMALGLEKARGRDFGKETVAVIGDSTFTHTGISGLIDVVYNKGNTLTIIADNSTTGMTGHQPNPTTGFDIHGEPSPRLDLEKLCAAVGVPPANIEVADPFKQADLEKAVRRQLENDGPSVIIARRPCILLYKKTPPPKIVNKDKCLRCGICLKKGCPAILNDNGMPIIDASQCKSCGLCSTSCPVQAIEESGETNG